MPTTEPTYGWPVATGTDPAKQYPAAVDQPFKTQLAAQLKSFTNGSYLRADTNTTVPLTAATTTNIPANVVNGSAGTDLTLSSGWIKVATTGHYEFGASIRAIGVPANNEIDLGLDIWRGGSKWLGWNIGAQGSSASMGLFAPAASHFAGLNALDEIRIMGWCQGTGASIQAGSFLWARRVG